jgi:glycosyltransferase involved in cell wall biosynthesis
MHPDEGQQTRVRVTVIATLLNEGINVNRLLNSLLAGNRLPDAIVVVDGGSTDDSLNRLHTYREATVPIEVVESPGANIATGRNVAFGRAATPWVAVTDAGVHLPPDWLESLMAPVERADPSAAPEVVAGFFAADPANLFELALGAVTLPHSDEITPTTFLPSSRSFACTRQAWADVGGYPAWLDYGEDVVFDLSLRAMGARFAWAPNAIALFRPRRSPQAFWLQYFRYARGDGKANLFAERHAMRYGAYACLALALAKVTRSRTARVPLACALALGIGVVARKPAARLLNGSTSPAHLLAALALVPWLRLIGDTAKMCGYPVGLWWRFRNKPPRWRS